MDGESIAIIIIMLFAIYGSWSLGCDLSDLLKRKRRWR